MRIKLPGDVPDEFVFVQGGFLEVQPTRVTVLADTAIRAHDLDEAKAMESMREAEEALKNRGSAGNIAVRAGRACRGRRADRGHPQAQEPHLTVCSHATRGRPDGRPFCLAAARGRVRRWELVCRNRKGQEYVAARHVVTFDVGADESVVYSNGYGVFRLVDGRLAVGSDRRKRRERDAWAAYLDAERKPSAGASPGQAAGAATEAVVYRYSVGLGHERAAFDAAYEFCFSVLGLAPRRRFGRARLAQAVTSRRTSSATTTTIAMSSSRRAIWRAQR